jgi:3-polyprenyl-4-hydroxybenzoate decarboxylase
MAAAFRILGEGQLALTKFLWVVDKPVDLRDPKAVLPTCWRASGPRPTCTCSRTCRWTRSTTADPRSTSGSKGVMLGVGRAVARAAA